MEALAQVNDRIDGVEGRVGRLEEQVSGDMGIIATLKGMQSALQEVRDSINKQAWLLPLATALITAVAVTLITRIL